MGDFNLNRVVAHFLYFDRLCILLLSNLSYKIGKSVSCTLSLGFAVAFALKVAVIAIWFIVNSDEIIKLPAVYRHYIKYKWVKDLTLKENEK